MGRQELVVRQEDTHVLLIVGGRLVANMPWDAALDLSRAIHVQAKQAEEIAKAAGIIADQAILIRIGAPIGLSSHPDILSEAAKSAAWDSSLRRYLPGGVKSKAVVGAPTVIRHDP